MYGSDVLEAMKALPTDVEKSVIPVALDWSITLLRLQASCWFEKWTDDDAG